MAARISKRSIPHELYDRLDRGDLILGDGAMGTMLQEAGLDDGGAPELWNVERPDDILAIHERYLRAGAQKITTNTFGGTRPRLLMHGLEDRAEELTRAGAESPAAAARYGVLVAGDVGPSGELLEPLGSMTRTRRRTCSTSRSAAWSPVGST